MTTAPEILIFVRHSKGCKGEGDGYYRRCDCRKFLRWTQNGKQFKQSTGSRSWAEAEKVKRELEDQLAGHAPQPETTSKLIAEAVRVFVQDKQVQKVSAGVVSRYRSELGRFASFCESRKVHTVQLIDRELITGYAATWDAHYKSSNTQASVRERLRGFLRYCYEAKWLDRVPQVPKVIVSEPPTMPLTDEEYDRVLAQIDLVRPMRSDARGVTRLLSKTTKHKLRALILLMRWTGLAIQDAVKLPKARLHWDEDAQLYVVNTVRQKTGTWVSVPLPAHVAEEILATPSSSPDYFFWSGISESRAQVIMWGSRYLRPLFESAGVRSGHMISHRLRDTFAVDLLRKGAPLEEVSKALGHESIKTTERHYSAWMPDRQNRLNRVIAETWTKDKPKSKMRVIAGGR
jgi:integrase/recombinase XerD